MPLLELQRGAHKDGSELYYFLCRVFDRPVAEPD